MKKNEARKQGLAARKALSLSQRLEKEKIITAGALALSENCQVIGCYVSMKEEVSTHDLIRHWLAAGKTVAVPKVQGSTLGFHRIRSFGDLREGAFGVMEPFMDDPVDLSSIEIMFVPLSAYDAQNNRTGYGKGYYDSILLQCSDKIGLAFAEQQVPCIEADPWDIPLDGIISA